MRTQNEIRAEMAEAQRAYETATATKPAHEARVFSRRVKALHGELSALLTMGAEPCEKCGGKPHGLRHIRGRGMGQVTEDGKPIVYFSHAYEVGCVNCGNKRAVATTPEELNGADLDQYADETIARAVKKWNEEQYLPSAKSPT